MQYNVFVSKIKFNIDIQKIDIQKNLILLIITNDIEP